MTSSNDPLAALQEIFHYPFMQHAFEAGTIVAIVAGIVGYFVVLRRSAFAAHALSHIGFAGGAGAALLAISPVYGLLAFTTVGGTSIAVLSPRARYRDVSIGTVMAFMLGLGLLFTSLYAGFNPTFTYTILFGDILGISLSNVVLTLVASVIIILAIAIIYRPLLFASLDEDVAEAKGVPTFLLSVIFMLLVAVTTSIAVQVVGVLLIFSLMVTPAAIAQRLAARPQRMVMISVAVALMAIWLGLFVAYFVPYPPSFFITSSVFILYLIVRLSKQLLKGRRIYPTDLEELATIDQ